MNLGMNGAIDINCVIFVKYGLVTPNAQVPRGAKIAVCEAEGGDTGVGARVVTRAEERGHWGGR